MTIETDEYFGGCPECGQNDGYLNVGGNHWFVCDAHSTCWSVGYNLFSSWRDESEDVWQANEERLRTMKIVEPVHQTVEAAAEETRRWRIDQCVSMALAGSDGLETGRDILRAALALLDEPGAEERYHLVPVDAAADDGLPF